MQIVDCLPNMTKSYLSRTVECLVKDGIPRGDEERMREQVAQNIDELADTSRISGVLRDPTLSRANRILMDAILTALLEAQDAVAPDEDLFTGVQEYEKGIIARCKDPDAFARTEDRSVDIYSAVLEVALEDEKISFDEHRLLLRLRAKLGLTRLQHRLMVARLGKFPKPNNELHTHAEYRDALKRLQCSGILFYCNRAESGAVIVLPQEIRPAVAKTLGFEMRRECLDLMLDSLTGEQLRLALKELDLPLSGNKPDRIERIVKAGCRPSEVLDTLSNSDLGELCNRLPGVKKSGTKAERIDRVVEHYATLNLKSVPESDDPRAVFYEYFEEFASRDNQNLYQLGIIKHDRDMESGFEEGTRYMFEAKFGHKLVDMPGNDHADGCVEFPNGELLLWDNKGKESTYDFPKAHADQFHRYIRESVKRVNVFLVIVPDIGDEAKARAMRMKLENPTDTDVAVISATELKWLAENWRRFTSSEAFNMQILNVTGILTRAALTERLTVFKGL